MEMDENSQVVTLQGVAELAMRSPETVMAEAEMVAKVLARKARQLGLYKQIGSSRHLKIEGWEMVAAMYRVTARITATKFLDFGQVRGFEATAEAYHIPTGQIVGRAEAMCLSDEENWGLRAKYEKDEEGKKTGTKTLAPVPLQQLRSMAQTRACSKVLSNLFKWIATMGGFAGTPAEEMTGHEYGPEDGVKPPERKAASPEDHGGAPVITEPQAKRMFAIAKSAGLPNEEYKLFLKNHGYERSADVRKADYEKMVGELVAMGGEA